MKTNLTLLLALALLTRCAKNTFQHASFHKREYVGVVTDIYQNNVKGTTFVLNGVTNVNVWPNDLDTTLKIGSPAVFKLGRLTNPIKKANNK